MAKSRTVTMLVSLTVMGACVDAGVGLGPMTYDASGTMECSAAAPTFADVCGWRAVRSGTDQVEIWISNIAVPDRPAYRVLDFAQGEFVARDGTPIEVGKTGDLWSVSVPGVEYYRFADAVITGG